MKREHVHGLIIAGGAVSLAVLIWVYVIPHNPPQKTADEWRRDLTDGQTAAVRAAAADALGAMGDVESMPALLAAMQDADVVARARAGVAVQKILGADFFFRASDSPEKREEVLQRIREHWEAWQAKLAEESPNEEP